MVIYYTEEVGPDSFDCMPSYKMSNHTFSHLPEFPRFQDHISNLYSFLLAKEPILAIQACIAHHFLTGIAILSRSIPVLSVKIIFVCMYTTIHSYSIFLSDLISMSLLTHLNQVLLGGWSGAVHSNVKCWPPRSSCPQ